MQDQTVNTLENIQHKTKTLGRITRNSTVLTNKTYVKCTENTEFKPQTVRHYTISTRLTIKKNHN